jgi:acyl carrier protein
MSNEGLVAELTDIFEDVMDIDDLELTDDTTADDIEEWDSLSHVRLIVAIERKYGIKFSNTEIESLKRFKDIVDLIVRKTSA